MNIPIVFISKSLKPYPELELVLKQAAKKNDLVYLLGDEENKQYSVGNFEYLEDYSSSYEEFESLYHHLSTLNPDIEKFCFSRWFIIRDFLKKNNYESVLHLDTDILFFANAEEEYERFKHLNCALSGRTSGHSSYFSIQGLEEFCEFVLHIYRHPDDYDFQKLASHFAIRQHYGLQGGLCDMTLLEYYARYHCPHAVGEVSLVSKGNPYYDHVIHVSEDFEMDGGIKKFTFKDGIPHGHSLRLDEDIPFATIHFQGSHKNLIEPFYNQSI